MKRILTLALAVVMGLGMTAPVFAASPAISGLTGADALERSYRKDPALGVSGVSNLVGSASVSNQTVAYTGNIVPNHEVKDYINLYVNAFTWDGDSPDNAGGLLTADQIKKGKLGIRTSVSSGSKAIDNVSINTRDANIEIEYATEYVSTKELDFQFTVYLTIDNKRYSKEGLTFVGTLANEVTDVYADHDYVDLSTGQVAHAQEHVKNIEVDLGNGVAIHTKFFKGKDYYGTASRDADEADDVVFSTYPDVDHVLTLNTVGLNSTGDVVRLNTDYGDYYVYDADLSYLGQSGEALPYRTKYYLANRKLDAAPGDGDGIGEAPQPEPEPEPEPGDGASGGGGGGGGVNASPGTGGGAPWRIAAATALISLSVAAAMAARRKKRRN